VGITYVQRRYTARAHHRPTRTTLSTKLSSPSNASGETRRISQVVVVLNLVRLLMSGFSAIVMLRQREWCSLRGVPNSSNSAQKWGCRKEILDVQRHGEVAQDPTSVLNRKFFTRQCKAQLEVFNGEGHWELVRPPCFSADPRARLPRPASPKGRRDVAKTKCRNSRSPSPVTAARYSLIDFTRLVIVHLLSCHDS